MRIIHQISMIAILVLLHACANGESEKKDGAPPVRVSLAPVENVSRSIPIYTSGVLQNPEEVRLSFKTGGIIDRLYVKTGSRVAQGALLATLKLDEIEAQVTQASAARAKAERDLKRVAKLYADSVATLEQWQNAQTGLEVASANLEIARFNRRHSAIYAPSSGRVLLRFAEVNEMVGPGSPIILFGSNAGLWQINAQVVDRDVLKLNINDSAIVRFDPYPGQQFAGTVTTISGTANPYSGLFEVEITLHPGEVPLLSGFIGKITLLPRQKKPFKRIPVAALYEADGREAKIFSVDRQAGRARSHSISVDWIDAGMIYTASLLVAVDSVVAAGTAYVRPNAPIAVVAR
jgi:multidrug efflux system membrane fusion protein